MTFHGAISTPVGVVSVVSDGGAKGDGLITKRWLLEHEGALPTALF